VSFVSWKITCAAARAKTAGLICINENIVWNAELGADLSKEEGKMGTGEIAYLALVIGAALSFMAVLAFCSSGNSKNR